MPSSAAILSQASDIANEWQRVGFAWHVYVGALLLAVGIGWQPSARRAAYLLILPLLSVALVAWTFGNPVNGSVFTLVAVLLSTTVRRRMDAPIAIQLTPAAVTGGLLIGFGWVYPHFLNGAGWLTYIYAAPLGLLPCPTLSMVMGMTLLLGMYRYRSWSAVLAVTGVVYGVIGVFALQVAIDYVLVAGACGLLIATLAYGHSAHRRSAGRHAREERVGWRRRQSRREAAS